MRVLVACEITGVVRDAFRNRGHDAYSCDIQENDNPYHLTGDVRQFLTDEWDLLIAHPPCQYLSSSGLHWNKRDPGRQTKTEQALDFVRLLMSAPIKRIAIENPVGAIGTKIRKADQYIQPYQFGHDASKKTGLWLKNLLPLRPTKFIEPRYICCNLPLDIETVGLYGCANCCGEKKPKPRWANQTDSGQNRLPPSDDRAAIRAATYAGIANAMADQWG